ncbi:uncharacterized protein LOC111274559 [Durio zibethinus]|uniref:Uncharacterized protein LOC111274559 n=1 Tax=Durio zibethinus TaxID=66656 RepID=A0A6P5WGI8_DURZI|nr:uncharacterized protein LOC111274559 [Durio zibethinus]
MEQKLYDSNGQPCRIKKFKYCRRVLQLVLLFEVGCISFPCLTNNSNYKHEIYWEDRGVGDDEIDGAVYLEEGLNGQEKTAMENRELEVLLLRKAMAKGDDTKDTQVTEQDEKHSSADHEEKTALLTNETQIGQENNIFLDENGIPQDNFAVNSTPYQPKTANRKILSKTRFITG